MIIDTHSHIYMDEDFPDDKAEVVERLKAAGVGKVILPNVDLSTIPQMHALADTDPDLFSCAMGLHPTEVKENWQSVLDEMFAYLPHASIALWARLALTSIGKTISRRFR